LGSIVKKLKAQYGSQVVFVMLYGDPEEKIRAVESQGVKCESVTGHREALKSLEVKRLLSIRFINRRTEVTGELTRIEKALIEEQIQVILK
jgi:hypothetical protein